MLVQHVSRKCSHNTWHPNVELSGTKDEFERSTCLSLLWVMRLGPERGESSAVGYAALSFQYAVGQCAALLHCLYCATPLAWSAPLL